MIEGQKTDAEITFGEFVDAVEGAPGPAPGNGDVVRPDPYPEILLPEIIQGDGSAAGFHGVPGADKKVLPRCGRCIQDGQFHAADRPQETLHFFGRVTFAWNRRRRRHDGPGMQVFQRKCFRRRQPRRKATEDKQQSHGGSSRRWLRFLIQFP